MIIVSNLVYRGGRDAVFQACLFMCFCTRRAFLQQTPSASTTLNIRPRGTLRVNTWNLRHVLYRESCKGGKRHAVVWQLLCLFFMLWCHFECEQGRVYVCVGVNSPRLHLYESRFELWAIGRSGKWHNPAISFHTLRHGRSTHQPADMTHGKLCAFLLSWLHTYCWCTHNPTRVCVYSEWNVCRFISRVLSAIDADVSRSSRAPRPGRREYQKSK